MPLYDWWSLLWDDLNFLCPRDAHACWLCVPALLMIIGTFKSLNSPISFYGNDREFIKLETSPFHHFINQICVIITIRFISHLILYQAYRGLNWPNCWVSSPKVISYSGTLSQGYPINSFYFRFGVSVGFGYLEYWPDLFFTPDHWSYVWICLSIFLNGKEWVFLHIILCKVSTGRAGNQILLTLSCLLQIPSHLWPTTLSRCSSIEFWSVQHKLKGLYPDLLNQPGSTVSKSGKSSL